MRLKKYYYGAEEVKTMAAEKPTDREDEFFIKMDMEKVKNLRGELDKKRKEAEEQKQKEEHWMNCPKCGSNLEEVNYENVMIDKCSGCQGIWLDAGELELLTEGQAQFTKSFLARLMGKA